MNVVAIIPARYGAARLPGKPLSEICGKPMIQHVHERALRAQSVDRVIVATDDARIATAVAGFGGEVVMTSPDHASGTDRVAEVARDLDSHYIVNVQGDEPMLDPAMLDASVGPLLADHSLEMATLSAPLGETEWQSPEVVKVVSDHEGNALYFSRAAIPFSRSGVPDAVACRHIGLYVYRRDALLRLASLPASPLERVEALEQLRALQAGMRIRVVEWQGAAGQAVDTAKDLERVRQLMADGASKQGAHA